MKSPAHRVVLILALAAVYGSFTSRSLAQFDQATLGARSISGQFIINGGSESSPLLHDPAIAANPNYLRLQPALLAVSAERFKGGFLHQLGLNPDTAWTGNIILALHAAHSADETTALTVGPLVRTWACQLQMPDVISVPRYTHGMCSALLLEYADRSSTDLSHVPELPAWLADGLGAQIMANDTQNVAVSAPAHQVDGLTQSRMDENQRGIDPLADTRKILQNSAALTFDQLCWPEPTQLDGQDGGVYAASAQLFAVRLLELPNGPVLMRDFLARLSGVLNWQTAFYGAYHEYFHRPLDVEKWWSLQVVRFAIRDPGPHWTPSVSQERLDVILAVPVQYRSSSNSLPVHTTVSLQSVILNFTAPQAKATLGLKLRDLGLATLRLSPPFASISMGYITVLRDYLGEGPRRTVITSGRMNVNTVSTASAKTTLQKLDALDKLRRDAEMHVMNAVPAPARTLNTTPH